MDDPRAKNSNRLTPRRLIPALRIDTELPITTKLRAERPRGELSITELNTEIPEPTLTVFLRLKLEPVAQVLRVDTLQPNLDNCLTDSELAIMSISITDVLLNPSRFIKRPNIEQLLPIVVLALIESEDPR
jgi:hypothetical protein